MYCSVEVLAWAKNDCVISWPKPGATGVVRSQTTSMMGAPATLAALLSGLHMDDGILHIDSPVQRVEQVPRPAADVFDEIIAQHLGFSG